MKRLTKTQLQNLKKRYVREGYKLAKKKMLREGDELAQKFHPYDTEYALNLIDDLIKDQLEYDLKTLQQAIKNIKEADGDEDRQQKILFIWLQTLKQHVERMIGQARINNVI